MHIRMITAEYGTLAKTGGLADMVAGLARWLHGRGHRVEVVVPDYGADHPPPLDRTGPPGWRVREHAVDGVRLRRVQCGTYFSAPAIYLGDARDASRFVCFGQAARALDGASDPMPDIVHIHDWHAAAALAATPGARTDAPPSLATIHNIGYQGTFDAADLPAWTDASTVDALRVPGEPDRVNFLASAIRRAGALNTVSPTHAREILTPEFGMGLDTLLGERPDGIHGILNGADYDRWNPAADSSIVQCYDIARLSLKHRNREAMRAELNLPARGDTPLVAMISRLAGHKGIDLAVDALPLLFGDHDFDCVVLGTGEQRFEQALRDLTEARPDRFRACLLHDESLAHRLLAAADMLLIPSRYEPCGLTQLYAMRYGTVPVVRATGGLADTVAHYDADTGAGTGVVFNDADVQGLTWSLRQALDWYRTPATWQQLVANAMAADFSWERQGPHYERLYTSLLKA